MLQRIDLTRKFSVSLSRSNVLELIHRTDACERRLGLFRWQSRRLGIVSLTGSVAKLLLGADLKPRVESGGVVLRCRHYCLPISPAYGRWSGRLIGCCGRMG